MRLLLCHAVLNVFIRHAFKYSPLPDAVFIRGPAYTGSACPRHICDVDIVILQAHSTVDVLSKTTRGHGAEHPKYSLPWPDKLEFDAMRRCVRSRLGQCAMYKAETGTSLSVDSNSNSNDSN